MVSRLLENAFASQKFKVAFLTHTHPLAKCSTYLDSKLTKSWGAIFKSSAFNLFMSNFRQQVSLQMICEHLLHILH